MGKSFFVKVAFEVRLEDGYEAGDLLKEYQSEDGHKALVQDFTWACERDDLDARIVAIGPSKDCAKGTGKE